MRRFLMTAVLAALPLCVFAEGTSTIEYIQNLTQKQNAAVSDAIILFAVQEGSDSKEFAAACDYLISKGILRQGQYNPDGALKRGLLAGMTARALGLKGSFMFNLTGADRYACTACAADGIMREDISEYDPVSGPELVEILGAVSSRGASNE